LQEIAPELEIVGEADSSVIAKAMTTKDEEEIARIRRMGRITVEVVRKVAEFLKSHKTKDEMLVRSDGQPLTIGEVKRKIDLWALERGVENPHGVIFALGRDGGVPHSAGTDEDVLRLGQSIVFDIYLREPGGGYHYDFTRTWCLGYAPEEVQAIYDDVLAVYQDLTEGLEANTPLAALQKRACELFEAQGHPTIASDRNTTDGYIHGIGHGLGLNIHEKPSYLDPEGLLSPGAVVTIEPGLYYPEKGMGCRLEDVYYVNPQGEVELLAEYPLDLVLEM
jgi:Xaa-Pro aminopeptidase